METAANPRPEAAHRADALRRQIAELDAETRHDVTIGLLREGFEQGLDPYLAIEVVTRVWETLGPARAREEAGALLRCLPDIGFVFQGDDFHKSAVERALTSLDLLIGYEQTGGDAAELAGRLSDHAKAAVWPRLWQLSAVQNRTGIGRLGVLYPHLYGCDPLQTIFAVDYFLTRNGFWQEALAALECVAKTGETPVVLIALQLAWLADVQWTLGRFEAAEEAFEDLFGRAVGAGVEAVVADADFANAAVRGLWAYYAHVAATGGDMEKALSLSSALREAARKVGVEPARACYAQLTLLLAHLAEDNGDIEGAEALYLEASGFDPGGYLPDAFHRATQFLVALDHWDEAATIQQRGLVALWHHYRPLARVSVEKRIETGELIPDRAVFLNCEGIGDDLWRILMYARLKGSSGSCAFVVDDRLRPALQRSMPAHEFLVRSRCAGSHAIDVETYHRDRIGVPASVDRTRVTRRIVDKALEYGEIALSEDIICEYYRQRGVLPHEAPRLRPEPARRQVAEAWLRTLPAGRLNVGVSWRSGLASAFRNRGHYRIGDLGPLLKMPGMNWIILQYGATEDEIEQARSAFGAALHAMPGLDLKDDIEEVIALISALDIVVTTPSVAEPLAGATGTSVLSLCPGYFSSAQGRIGDDGETNRILPNITMLSARKFGARQAIVREAARCLADLAKSRGVPT